MDRKKDDKKFPTCWKFLRYGYIVTLVFILSTEVCTSDESGGAATVALREAREAREAAERRAVQLELELEQTKKTLARTRSRYADLYLRSHGLLRSLRQTELQVSNLWHNKDDTSMGGLTTRLLEAMEAAGGRQLKVVAKLDEFEASLRNVLDVLRPSEAMRREVEGRLRELRGVIELSLGPLSAASGARAGVSDLRRGCRVVATDAGLDVLLLEGGSLQGMAPESRWHLTVGDRVVAKAVVIDVRLELSAAVLVEGTLTDVPVGSVLLPDGGVR